MQVCLRAGQPQKPGRGLDAKWVATSVKVADPHAEELAGSRGRGSGGTSWVRCCMDAHLTGLDEARLHMWVSCGSGTRRKAWSNACPCTVSTTTAHARMHVGPANSQARRPAHAACPRAPGITRTGSAVGRHCRRPTWAASTGDVHRPARDLEGKVTSSPRPAT